MLTLKSCLSLVALAAVCCAPVSRLNAAESAPLVAGSAPLVITNSTPDSHVRHRRLLWLVSIPVFIAANVLDAGSSWGKPEANRVLQGSGGRFDGKSAALKFGIAGSMIVGEYSLIRMLKRDPASKDAALTASAWSNFVGAGVLSGTAIHNYRLSH